MKNLNKLNLLVLELLKLKNFLLYYKLCFSHYDITFFLQKNFIFKNRNIILNKNISIKLNDLIEIILVKDIFIYIYKIWFFNFKTNLLKIKLFSKNKINKQIDSFLFNYYTKIFLNNIEIDFFLLSFFFLKINLFNIFFKIKLFYLLYNFKFYLWKKNK